MTEEFNGYSTENPGAIKNEIEELDDHLFNLPCRKLDFNFPGDRKIFSDIIINEFGYRKIPSNGLIPLDENKVFEIVRANNNTFVSDTDCRYISKTLCSKFGVKAPSISVEELADIIYLIDYPNADKVQGRTKQQYREYGKAIHSAITGEK